MDRGAQAAVNVPLGNLSVHLTRYPEYPKLGDAI
jgi:hypothetical protein